MVYTCVGLTARSPIGGGLVGCTCAPTVPLNSEGGKKGGASRPVCGWGETAEEESSGFQRYWLAYFRNQVINLL